MNNPNGQISGAAPKFGKALPAVLFVTAIFFINYTNRAITGPLLVPMERELGLDHVQSTSFLLFLSSGFCAGVLVSGFVASMIRPRVQVAISAVFGGCILLLLSRAASPEAIRLLLTFLGIFSGFYMTAALATLDSLVRPEDWSLTIAVHELSPAVSFILTPLLAEIAALHWGWQGAMMFVGILSLCGGTLFLFCGKGGTEKVDRPSAAGVISAIKAPVFWAFVWVFGLSISGEFAPFSVLSLSLTAEQGLDNALAARLLSFSRIISPFAVLAGGWAATHLGAQRTIRLFLIIHGISLICLAAPISLFGKPGVFLAMTSQATATAFVFPALFTVFARSFPHRQQPMILSIALPMASFLGTGLAPFLLGVSGQFLTFSQGFFIFGILSLATLPVLRFFTPPRG